MMPRMDTSRGGFSLVEVIVAIVVLSVGLLAMAATTGYILTRIRISGLETERAAASQQVGEWLRAQPFVNLQSRDASTPVTIGGYRFWWEVRPLDTNFRQIVVVSEGRGYRGVQMSESAQDTFVISVFRP